MDHDDDDPIERGSGCGIAISPGIDRGFAFGPTGVLCPACSAQRGDVYDAERDRRVVEPDVQELTVASPDVGCIKRAHRYREAFGGRLGREIPGAFVEKHRHQDLVSGEAVVGPVEGRSVVLVDGAAFQEPIQHALCRQPPQLGPAQACALLVDPDLARLTLTVQSPASWSASEVPERCTRTSNQEDRCRVENVRGDSGAPDSEHRESPERPSGCMLDP